MSWWTSAPASATWRGSKMRPSGNARDVAAILTPPAVCVTMYVAFDVLSQRFGPVTGYFSAFLLYWVVWCGLVPFWILGSQHLRQLVSSPRAPFGQPAWAGMAAVAVPLLLGYGYAFPRALPQATAPAIALSAFLAMINGPFEELLWRGVYVARFGHSVVWGYLYPAAGFAIWHLAPLSIHGNRAPGGAASFIFVSGVIGLLWGWLARHSGSIRWTIAAHILFDFSGLGGRLYFS
jgi:membrane protease YdiL (CAAX protease family)